MVTKNFTRISDEKLLCFLALCGNFEFDFKKKKLYLILLCRHNHLRIRFASKN